jgi:3-deoxy-manno-octulosonate cytidylyltransferase (CMP-KDO synthetase)
MTRCQIVLPARLASTRLPEKLLRRVAGKSVLQHTFEAASRATVAQGIVVAVDDERLASEVDSFGGHWLMTSKSCASGTDRIAQVASAMPDVDVFINLQSDEPEIDPHVIDLVASQLIDDPHADMATAGTPIRELELLQDPSCVKIVMATAAMQREVSRTSMVETSGNHEGQGDRAGHGHLAGQKRAGQGRAVYFSRASVPFVRDGITPTQLEAEPPLFWHHIGLYAYRRDFLEWFAASPPSMLEQAERLEQLRAIEAGKRIVAARVESATPGIDTQADLDAFTERMMRRNRDR